MSTTKERNYSTKVLLQRFMPYFYKYRWTLLFDLTCAGASTLTDIFLPMILRTLVSTARAGVEFLSIQFIFKLALIYLVLRTIDLFGSYFMANMGHVMGAKIETDMRRDAFDHLQKLSVSYYNNTKVGQIMSRITSDLFDVTEFAHHCPEEFFIGALKFVLAFVILIRINIALTLILFVTIPIMIFCASRYNHAMRRTFKNQRKHIGELNSGIEDNLLGARVVKSFANEDLEREKFEDGNLAFLSIKKQSYKYMAGFHTVTKAFDGIMYLEVIIVGGIMLIKGSLLPEDLFLYSLYVGTLLATVRRIVEFMEQFQRGMTGIERFFEILDTDIEIFDEPDAEELNDVKGDIVFKNVSFGYNDADGEVISDVSLSVKAGEKIALVGPSGSGKTTLCNLIPRFYDVTSGVISIDGKSIKDVTLKSLRNSIGMVQQDVYLFAGTVYDNIAYGKPNATEAEVREAARLAGADEFIEELTNGYDTYVGERGVKLSGGQKQRISIARVFLKNPPILILDEATSALDNKSEKLIQASLEELSKGRTVFTIAHRLTTIQNSTMILVLTEDGIVERGNHDELMAQKGMYYKLYTSASFDK